ncbi:MAG: hypothetical protein JNG86_12730, partial [Verrucomicrobiaceae bacterium]|nr:hypothetical protein [Verrucomicrobiaceae bacterium]
MSLLALCSLLSALSALSALCAAAEPAAPTRTELWIPTDQLDVILKKHPKAVLLTKEQYDTLIRDAGKSKPE